MQVERRKIVDRAQWLAWHDADITASVIGALFGVHPYSTRLRENVKHRGVEFENKDTKVTRRGRWLEPAVAKAVAELRPNWLIEPANEYLRIPELKLGATPDFYIYNDPRGLGVLQAKSVAPVIWHRDWDDGREVPLWIILQAATEMMLADAAFGAVAVLVVDPFQMDCEIIELPRNAAAEAKIIAAVKQFWNEVEASIEPEPDFGKDADVIRAMTAAGTAGKEIDLSGNNMLPEYLERRANLMRVIKDAETECADIETELKYLMRDAEIATGVNGWRITFKNVDRKEYTVPAKTSRQLRVYDRREKDATQ